MAMIAALGRGVGLVAGRALEADTDEVTASAPPSPRSTMWRTAARNVKKTPSRSTRSTRRHVLGRDVDEAMPAPADAGVGEARVDLAQRPSVSANDDLDLRLVADVAFERQHLGAVPLELLERSPVLVLVRAPDGHVGALRARPSAIPSPMPLLPPVIKATFPLRSNRSPTGGDHTRTPIRTEQAGERRRSARSNVQGYARRSA